MRRISFLFAVAFAFLLLPATGFAAHNPADYPLRVHVFTHSGFSHYWGYGGTRNLEGVDGEGRANLYENSQPRGFDFKYECEERLQNNMGYETYLARWKKPNVEMELLLPITGHTCKFHVAMKDGVVYTRHNGNFTETPADKFKAWMDKYQYDPEHGKNTPTRPAGEQASALDPASFPLRVHIFTHTGVSHYGAPGQSAPEVVEGEGRANLYENSQPHGLDFSYHCPARLMDSLGYDTYPARWVEPGRKLEILQPATDKTCVLDTAVKPNVVYTGDANSLQQQPSSTFKIWMEQNQYDPEHGQDLPTPPAAH
jgi:hypothetical protein